MEDLERLSARVGEHSVASIPAGDLQPARAGHREAEERVLRAVFWTFVFHVEPDMWDRLAQVEPIHTGIMASLPHSIQTCLDVGAGRGD